MSDCECSIEIDSREQGRVPIALLAYNAAMFVWEIVAVVLRGGLPILADARQEQASKAVASALSTDQNRPIAFRRLWPFNVGCLLQPDIRRDTLSDKVRHYPGIRG